MKKSPPHLKLHLPAEVAEVRPDDPLKLDVMCKAFEAATGWPLRRLPANGDSTAFGWSTALDADRAGPKDGFLVLDTAAKGAEAKRAPLQAVEELAAEIALLFNAGAMARRSVRSRDAELATGVPISVGPREAEQLADRLEGVLRDCARCVNCQAAGLYLLDDATSVLKLRSAWGLPSDRLVAPARPLENALADLEALLGHTVTLGAEARLPQWRSPEDFPAAACTPIAGSETPLGVLWVFCDHERQFSTDDARLLEMAAGRLWAEMERQALLHEALWAKQLVIRQDEMGDDLQGDTQKAWRVEETPLERPAPLLEGWRLAVRLQSSASGRHAPRQSFYDWWTPRDGAAATALGAIEAATPATAERGVARVQAGLRAHSEHNLSADETLVCVGRHLWSASAGDCRADAFYARADLVKSSVEWAAAGRVAVFHLAGNKVRRLPSDGELLGGSADDSFPRQTTKLEVGEAILAIEYQCAAQGSDRRAAEGALTKTLGGMGAAPAQQLADRAATLLTEQSGAALSAGVLVLQRTD